MMKDFKADTWDSFQKTARGKKVYIWGAGKRGASIANILNAFATEYEFCGFVDKKVNSTLQLLCCITLIPAHSC